MKFEIKFTEKKNIKFDKKPFVYIKFTPKNSLKSAFALFAIQPDKKLIKKFEKGEVKEVEFNLPENISSKVIVKKIEEENLTEDFFRDFLASVIADISEETKTLIVDFPSGGEFIEKYFRNFDYYVQTLAEGILLGNYVFDKFKTEKKSVGKLNVEFYNEENIGIKKVFPKAEKLINAVYFARDLVNEPANVLTPQEFAKRLKREFKGTKVKVEILNEEQLRKRNMNAIISVGQASANPPLLVKLTYKGKKPKDKIALVGKGVMYDAGGLSIKPTSGMVEMKGDMAGAAAVAGILKAADALELSYDIYGVIPVVENVISGNSYKPGDIIHTASGKTIEIGNTDAEGRLILADALEYAEKLKPNKIFDFATLTGACLVALGESYAGIFSDNDEIVHALLASSDLTSEKIWQLPMPKQYEDLLKSELADISNIGSTRWGGSITAALFLKFFLSEDARKNWVHFDIAGPALKHNQASYTKKYATGFGVRLIISWLENGLLN